MIISLALANPTHRKETISQNVIEKCGLEYTECVTDCINSLSQKACADSPNACPEIEQFRDCVEDGVLPNETDKMDYEQRSIGFTRRFNECLSHLFNNLRGR
ncbi:hypothetical protein ASPWEDRAFT_537985 [Aspergillus wentii DTO 134E9]|uniref:Uncharacterized protein n=1 Tax=Aspergillus wentii DTO 134E9 TaxID=1073089 RepID=A0A1L9RN36_ASPWE|nr:uncharacterized protein ASPWEDRAFT_537985 [Aspergillus wentii DTO 134E9]OJJ36238.1 hypothetical protein ASPWEDRAFT_537985 [Aspergillus wentii DTO 134E9]